MISPDGVWLPNEAESITNNPSAFFVYLFENFHNSRWLYINVDSLVEGYISVEFFRNQPYTSGLVRRLWNGNSFSPYFLIQYIDGDGDILEVYGGQDIHNLNNFPVEYNSALF